ncbi:MAG: EamA family transporter [Hyphomicrobiales bacterium]|nr:EamA family transporter [Hyphomicrobiales bacterium]
MQSFGADAESVLSASSSSSQGRTAAAFAAIYLLWGGTYLAIALGLRSIPPFLLIAMRSLLGGAALFAYSRSKGSDLRSWPDWAKAALSGALLFIGCHGALAYAQRVVPSGLAAILLATIPFWIVLINAVTGQKEPPLKIVGLIPGFAGVTLIAWHEVSDRQGHTPILMIALLLASSLSWAMGSVYAQRKAAHIPPRDLASMQLICGGCGLLILSLVAGEWASFSPRQVSMISLAGLLYLGLLGSALGNTAYLWLLDRLPAPIVATYTFVNPVIAVALGVIVLGERLTAQVLIGAALVLASVAALLSVSYAESRLGRRDT